MTLTTPASASKPRVKLLCNIARNFKRGDGLHVTHRDVSFRKLLFDCHRALVVFACAFAVWLFVKIKEPKVFFLDVFSASSLCGKSIVFALWNWTVEKTVFFIMFQVKSFWFGQSVWHFGPVDGAFSSSHLLPSLRLQMSEASNDLH